MFCFSCSTSWLGMYVFYVSFLYIAQVVLQFFVFRTWKNVVCMIGREKKTDNFLFLFMVWDQRGRDNLIQCLVMCFFSYFFLFFSFKKLLYCCVLSTSVRYFYSSIVGEEKSAGKHLLVKMCQQQSGLTSFFFSLFLAANSNRSVCSRLFLSISFLFFFFPTAITIMIRLFFADFFRIIYLFSFYYSLSDFGSFSSFSSESSALPLLDLLLSSVATAFLTEWKMRFLT